MPKELDPPPEPSRKDKAIAIGTAAARGTLGIVPYLAEVFDLLWRQPIEKRREEWLRDVGDAIHHLQDRQAALTPENLAKAQRFVTVLHRATDFAMRTHEEEKRRALRNAILNSAGPTAPDLDRQLFFLRLIDDLSVNQVLILELFRDPRGWFAKRQIKPQEFSSASRHEVLRQAYPQLAEHPHLKELVIAELQRRGLMGDIGTLMTGSGIWQPATTKIGHEFIDFISRPEQDSTATRA